MKKDHTFVISGISFLISIVALVFSFADIRIGDLQFKPDHFLAVIGAIMSSIGFVLAMYFAWLAVGAYGDIKKIEEQAKTIETHKTNIDNHAEAIQQNITKTQNLAQEAEKANKSIADKVEETQELSQKIEATNTSIENQIEKIQGLAKKAEESKSSIDSILNFYTNNYLVTIEYQMALDDYLVNSLDKENRSHQKLFTNYREKRELLRKTRARMSYGIPYLETEDRIRFLIDLGGLGDETDLPHLNKILESENEIDKIKELAKMAIKNIEDRLNKS